MNITTFSSSNIPLFYDIVLGKIPVMKIIMKNVIIIQDNKCCMILEKETQYLNEPRTCLGK